MYNFEVANAIIKLLDQNGIINVGGDSQTVYDFAKKENANIDKISISDIKDVEMAPDTSMNIEKLKGILK